ncbi:hypothetical protein WMY93_020886 [Mugilogobius chulae]|uniref:ZP domain-containing protein n=1 Tax=Mugilogobius chulae TaxID=88201 RepID=A0AAW0NEY3_9GOBI
MVCDKGECAVESLCSVIGSQLIDFKSATASIPDRCAYTLLEETQGIKVVGVFKERRRKDTNLVDHLVITYDSNIILLARGTVKLDGTVVDDLSTAAFPKQITVTKTATEMTLTYSTVLVLVFDGDSVVLNVKDSSVVSGGACSDSTKLAAAKDGSLSSQGCDTAETEAADATIDAAAMNAQCDLLTGSPFSDCNALIDPTGIIKACKEFLGNYGSKDTTDCAFHQAYATICGMAKVTLTDWRTTAQCVSSAGQCLETACVSHEFCGLVGSEPKCLCRAIMKSAFTGNSVGGPTVCSGSSASLNLAICTVDPVHGILNFAFDSTNECGTEVKTENSQMIFSNQVQLTTADDIQQGAVITRHDQFQVDFSCYYSLPEVKNVALKIKSGSVVDTVTSGEWTYTLTMTAYENEDRSTEIAQNTEILLDQPVWVELKTDGLDENLVSIVTTSCWATSEKDKDATLKYDLIITPGCPNGQDSSVKVDGNGLGTSMFFSFNMFQFTGKSSDVYLHCEVSLCAKSDKSPCAPAVSGRHTELTVFDLIFCVAGLHWTGKAPQVPEVPQVLLKDPNPGLISMSWTKVATTRETNRADQGPQPDQGPS